MKFDLIVMNPPFTKDKNSVYWLKFLKKAQSLLSEDGQVVAVVPDNVENRKRTWTGVLATDVQFEGVSIKGMVVTAGADAVKKPQASAVRNEDFAKYGFVVRSFRPKADEPVVSERPALVFPQQAPGHVLMARETPWGTTGVRVIEGPADALDRLRETLKSYSKFRGECFTNRHLLEIVKDLFPERA